eukprot:3369078-Pyramimonas_sp.AAC.1
MSSGALHAPPLTVRRTLTVPQVAILLPLAGREPDGIPQSGQDRPRSHQSAHLVRSIRRRCDA